MNMRRKTIVTCDENLWQYRRKYISRPNLRCRCCMYDENSWKIATNFHRYCDGCGKIQYLELELDTSCMISSGELELNLLNI